MHYDPEDWPDTDPHKSPDIAHWGFWSLGALLCAVFLAIFVLFLWPVP